MARGKLRFKERDVTRAIRAAEKSGMPPQKVEIDPEGKIIIILGAPHDQQGAGENEWDTA